MTSVKHRIQSLIGATLLVATAGGSTLAQGPEIGLRIVAGLDTMTMEGADCTPGNSDGISINVGQADPGTQFTSAVDTPVFAIILSGPNRFADRHGGHVLRTADDTGWIAAKNDRIGSSSRVTWAHGQSGNALPLR